jgi:hypothetical protein
MNEQTAQKFAKWWADHLRCNAKLDNGDKSYQGAMTLGLASMLQEKEKAGQTLEQIDKFEKELAGLLLQDSRDFVYVSVDYAPDCMLSFAAEKANLQLGSTTLPWKTNMWINKDEIEIRCGYYGEIQKLE